MSQVLQSTFSTLSDLLPKRTLEEDEFLRSNSMWLRIRLSSKQVQKYSQILRQKIKWKVRQGRPWTVTKESILCQITSTLMYNLSRRQRRGRCHRQCTPSITVTTQISMSHRRCPSETKQIASSANIMAGSPSIVKIWTDNKLLRPTKILIPCNEIVWNPPGWDQRSISRSISNAIRNMPSIWVVKTE